MVRAKRMLVLVGEAQSINLPTLRYTCHKTENGAAIEIKSNLHRCINELLVATL